jgi:hypothetical protein
MAKLNDRSAFYEQAKMLMDRYCKENPKAEEDLLKWCGKCMDMTDLQKQIERIVALDKRRSKGKWFIKKLRYCYAIHTDDMAHGSSSKSRASACVANCMVINGADNAAFLNAAPEMVSIILALRQQIKERDEVMRYALKTIEEANKPQRWADGSLMGDADSLDEIEVKLSCAIVSLAAALPKEGECT